jgi:hypothetical protein
VRQDNEHGGPLQLPPLSSRTRTLTTPVTSWLGLLVTSWQQHVNGSARYLVFIPTSRRHPVLFEVQEPCLFVFVCIFAEESRKPLRAQERRWCCGCLALHISLHSSPMRSKARGLRETSPGKTCCTALLGCLEHGSRYVKKIHQQGRADILLGILFPVVVFMRAQKELLLPSRSNMLRSAP